MTNPIWAFTSTQPNEEQLVGNSGSPVLAGKVLLTAAGAPGVAGVANIAALQALPAAFFTGLPEGAIAATFSIGAYWAYMPNGGGTVDGITTVSATNGPVGAQWWRFLSFAAPQWQAQLSWTVNLATGNDENAGTPGAPLQHVQEIVRRWGTLQPQLPSAGVAISLQTSQPITDPWPNVEPRSGKFTITGTLIQQATGLTINTFTAKVTTVGAGTRDTINVVGEVWAPFIGMIVRDTTVNADFIIDADLGGGTAAITEPFASPVGIVPALRAIAAGDALTIFQPSTLFFEGEVGRAGAVGLVDIIQQCTIAPVAGFIRAGSGAAFIECVIAAGGAGQTVLQCESLPESGAPIFSSCYAKAGQALAGTVTVFGGSVCNANGNFQPAGGSSLDGFVIMNAEVSFGSGQITFGPAYFGGRPIFRHIGNGTTALVVQNGNYGAPFIWGANFINIGSGNKLGVFGVTAVAGLKITLQIDGATTAFTFNPATGAYSAGAVALTAATIDANGAMLNPNTESWIGLFTGP